MTGALWAACAALLFSTKGILVKLAFPYGVDATGFLGMRMALALPCFVAVWWWIGRRSAPLARGDLLRASALGVLGYHCASWLDFQGLRFVDVATERMVLYLYPTLVVFFAFLAGRGHLSRWIVAALILTYGGIGLTWAGHPEGGPDVALGVTLVAVSAAVYALYLVLAEPVIGRVGGLRFIAVAMTAACVSVLLQVLITRPLASWVLPAPVYGYGLLLALPATVIPALLTGVAIRRIGPGPFAIIGALGPVSTVLLGWAILHERPGGLAWIGIVLTIAGGVLVSVRKPPRAAEVDED
jgi:drug/metabolite transporter (DMT)-like permease